MCGCVVVGEMAVAVAVAVVLVVVGDETNENDAV